MASSADIISQIDDAVNSINGSIPSVQRQLYDELITLTNRLEIKTGRIAATAKNIRLIGEIKQKFEKLLVRNDDFNKNVNDFTKAFGKVESLQKEYFAESVKKFTPPKVLAAIRQESVQATVDNLLGNGMKASIVEPVREILRTNITSGAKYSDLVKGLRDFMITNKTGEGELVKYVKQITTDALNQYARSNISTITSDLGLEWYSYNGAIIDTSRPFCVAMHKKKFFHKSEIPDLIKGDFQEFKDADGKIDAKTGLPYGMIKGTTADNFLVNLGGYNCNHQPVPVDELVVPLSKRKAKK